LSSSDGIDCHTGLILDVASPGALIRQYSAHPWLERLSVVWLFVAKVSVVGGNIAPSGKYSVGGMVLSRGTVECIQVQSLAEDDGVINGKGLNLNC
jgi:hypothetical protein